MASFEIAIEEILIQEGGYSNDPLDRGGETKYGISKRAFPAVDIPSLTVETAKQIYRENYWKFESVSSQKVANKLLDMAVNMGVSTAVRLLQNSLSLVDDGIFGPKSLEATNQADPDSLLLALRIASARHYLNIVSRNHSQFRFLKGWLLRAIR